MCSHQSRVVAAELEHGGAVGRVGGDVAEVMTSREANLNRVHSRLVQLRPEWVRPGVECSVCVRVWVRVHVCMCMCVCVLCLIGVEWGNQADSYAEDGYGGPGQGGVL